MGNRIPQAFIDELLNRTDIVSIIDQRVPLKKAGREYKACCPFHGEKTPSFTVSPTKQFYHCFGCGVHGNAISFLMEYDHASFIESLEELARLCGMELPEFRPTDNINADVSKKHTESLYQLLEWASKWFRQQLVQHPQRQIAVDYLKSRGLTGNIAKEFELGFAPDGWHELEQALDKMPKDALVSAGLLIEKDGRHYDRFRNRVMFPIRDRRGRVVGFGGRVMVAEEEPKYLNSPETPVFHKGHELYGLYQVKKTLRQIESVFVVEGYMDVVSLAQHGIHNAVASLGTALTSQHIQILLQTCRTIIFCFDGDRAGRQAAWRALETSLPAIDDDVELRFMFLPEGEDPDSMVRTLGAEGFNRQAKTADSFTDFMLDQLLMQADIQSIEGQAKLVKMIRPLITQMENNAVRSLLVSRLAERVQLPRAELQTRLFGEQAAKQNQTARPLSSAAHTSRRQLPSTMRLAIRLLLEQPSLASEAGNYNFEHLSLPGIKLFQQLLDIAGQNPHVSKAAFIERLRHQPEWQTVSETLQWHTPALEQEMETEFRDCLENLHTRWIEQQMDDLLQTSRKRALSSEEKIQFQKLLTQVHQTAAAN